MPRLFCCMRWSSWDCRSKLIIIQRLCLQAADILTIPMVTILVLASVGLVFMVAGKVQVALTVVRNVRQAHDVIGERPWLEPCRADLEEVRRLTPPKTCEPKHTLVFVKTHRTGSSTIQNVFLRYGDKNNLTFAFPPRGNYFWSPKDIPPDLYPEPGHKFDIFCFHTVMERHELLRIMKPKSTWITVMRDPRHLFESMYRYFGMQNKRFFNITFEQFLEHPPPPEGRHTSLLYGSNQMALDLGMSVHHFHIPNRVKVYVEYMEEIFSLVMIAEKMDESMVLLRHHMCWDIVDVVAFHINARFNKKSTDPFAGLSEKQLKNLDLVTFADRSLYAKFRAIFDTKLADFGEDRMEAEKQALKCVRDRLKDVCGVKTLAASYIKPYGMFQPYGPALGFIPAPDPAFKSYPEFNWACHAMSYTEEKYIELLREKQREMHRPDLFTAARAAGREKKRNNGP